MQTSIIPLSETQVAGRLDAEFFDPRVLENKKIIENQNFAFLDTFISELTGGATPLGAEYLQSGVPFLRVQNIMQNYIDISDIVYISIEDNNILARSQLKEGDVLLTITGVSFGKSAVVTKDNEGSNINQHSVRIATNNISPYFLSTFLNCKYGYTQSTRYIVGVTRPALDYSSIKKFQIPLFSPAFQKKIEAMVLEAHAQRETANRLSAEAQELLEKELGLFNWQPPKPRINVSVRPYSQTLQAKRIDAEYYQQRYEAIINKLKAYKGGVKTLGEVYIQSKASFKADSSLSYKYVEISCINTGNGDITPLPLMGYELPANAKRLLKKDDIIVSKVRPYRGAIAIIDRDGYVGSGAFTILQENIVPKLVNKETIYTFLRLPLVLELSLKPSTGTSYPVILDDDILSMPIPIIRQETQNEIAQKVQQAHAARQKAKGLLQQAKEAVERAIEKGEYSIIKNGGSYEYV